MKDDISKYARLGLVHHLLYPKCMEDADDHAETLAGFVQRGDIETFDCCLPYGDDRQQRLVPLIRNCGKSDIAFASHLFPYRMLSPCSLVPHEQAQVRLIMKDLVQQAGAVGASRFIFASGGPGPADAAEGHYGAFAELCRWLCGELRQHGITALLEPFDTAIDKKFLYGSTESCVALVESLQGDGDNFGIELDVGHVPLIGESFEHAIRTAGPVLQRVHLGNCVLKDKSNPRYGDTHPPVGWPPGEIDVPELTEILRCLLDIGFLNQHQRGSLLLEMTPWPGRTAEETVTDSLDRLGQAWNAA